MDVECLHQDRISNLPSCMIQTILTLMPLRDAFRTSILSRAWRYHCVKIPKLEFDDKLLEVSTNDHLCSVKCKVFHVMYNVLLVCQGPLLEFSLCVSQLQSCWEIDRIIFHLAHERNATIEKFTICIGENLNHKLPSSFFLLQNLAHLKLQNCAIQPRSANLKFSKLTSLWFHNVSITMTTLLLFLGSCPVLKSFTLTEDDKYLEDDGNIEDDAHSYLVKLFQCMPLVEHSYLVELFQCMPLVEYLHMNDLPIEVMAYDIPFKLPNLLVHLRVFELTGLSFAYDYELRVALLLVTSSPNIQKIRIEMYYNPRHKPSEDDMNLLDLQDYFNVTLDHLRELEITNFGDIKPAMDFVKLILANSPMLKKVRLVIDSQIDLNVEVKMQRDLLQYQRASNQAQIIIEDP